MSAYRYGQQTQVRAVKLMDMSKAAAEQKPKIINKNSIINLQSYNSKL